MNDERHVISVLVDNKPGVLSRISGLFSGRGYNIDSLCVAETLDNQLSRITITTHGDAGIVEQITKQLHKLINVVKVHDFTGTKFIQRETALIKVTAKPEFRAEILRIADIFNCRVVNVGKNVYTLEVTGDDDKLVSVISLLKPMGIKEIARTGAIALGRDPK